MLKDVFFQQSARLRLVDQFETKVELLTKQNQDLVKLNMKLKYGWENDGRKIVQNGGQKMIQNGGQKIIKNGDRKLLKMRTEND